MAEFNLAEVHEAVAAAVPDRECIVFRDRRLSYAEVTERSRRLANLLLERGITVHRERSELAGHECGQDTVALYLYNGNEYLEGMLGAFKARAAPFNVNYRYVADELRYLLADARASAVIYHARFAPVLEQVLPELDHVRLLLQVDDGSGVPLLEGALDYEEALAASSPERPEVVWSPDDLYILYTGGTTGMPKGVLWRQSDIFHTAMGGRRPDGTSPESLDDIVAAAEVGGMRVLSAPPLMHGMSQWVAFTTFAGGGTVVLQSVPERLDPHDIWRTVEDERVAVLGIVGDAFAQPLLEDLETHGHDPESLLVIVNGGAALNATTKARLLERLGRVTIMDGVGSSETGSQMSDLATAGTEPRTGVFQPAPGTVVLNEARTAELTPGDPEIGWLASRGRVPLGYLGDPDKTAATFPVIDGVRYSVPGDRARWLADGRIELLGRDSVTINTGGEKVFAEEVEQALLSHPDVVDCVVVGRPDPRWGQEVVALVRLADGATVTDDELVAHAAGRLARYKLPKRILRLDEIVRSPAGKADYRWARSVAEGAPPA